MGPRLKGGPGFRGRPSAIRHRRGADREGGGKARRRCVLCEGADFIVCLKSLGESGTGYGGVIVGEERKKEKKKSTLET